MRFDLKDAGFPIGFSNCSVLEDNSIRIDDLIIYPDDTFDDWYGWTKRWIQRHVHDRLWHYRNNGLGTAFLKLILDEARRKKVERIEGSVCPERPEDGERLLDWYRRMGFAILPPRQHERIEPIADIEMAL